MKRPVPVTLQGAQVRLLPLTLGHLDALCVVGLDPELWRLIPSKAETPEEMRAYLETALDEQRRGVSLPFVTALKGSGQVVGSSRYMNVDVENRRLEIGCTWIGKPWQRSAVNTEAKLLMLKHAFEVLGCVRVELKTDFLNQQSRNAILRLGAKQEGIFRRHVLTWTGRMRDTVYFSILDDEWPGVRAGLEAKLAART
jgi:RimJ/RimL family protein N-acetyltransferase